MQGDPAADRLDPVLEPDEAGAVSEVRATAPVVADTDPQNAVVVGHLDLCGRGAGMLGGIGQRLGHHVVGGDLDLVWRPTRDLDVQVNRDGAAAGQRPQRRAKPCSTSQIPLQGLTWLVTRWAGTR